MDGTCEGGDPPSDVVYVNFNQASTGLQVGLKNGYRLYKFEDINKLHLDYECPANEEVCLIERQYLSSLVAFVKLSCPRKLIFYNFNNNAEIGVKHFANTILAVKLNRKIFVVVLEDSIHIFDTMNMHLAHVITNTPSNPKGICTLTTHNNDTLLAYPASNTVGDVQIFDCAKLLAKNSIPAHNNPVACISFNDEGTQLATASEKGTVIRIFNVSDGNMLFEFRRGVRRYVTIYSLSFSAGSEYLCASSNTETVHIFKLSKDEESPVNIGEESEGWMATMGKMLTHSVKYLPSQMSEVLTQERSFATIHLPFSGLKNVSCLTRIKKVMHVFVASTDGILYIYYLNMEGGPCTLAKQHRLGGTGTRGSFSDLKHHSPESVNAALQSSSPYRGQHKNTSGDTSSAPTQHAEQPNDSDGEGSDSCPPLSFNVT